MSLYLSTCNFENLKLEQTKYISKSISWISKTFFEKKAFARTGEAFEQQTKEHIFFQLSLILHFNFRYATCLGASNS